MSFEIAEAETDAMIGPFQINAYLSPKLAKRHYYEIRINREIIIQGKLFGDANAPDHEKPIEIRVEKFALN